MDNTQVYPKEITLPSGAKASIKKFTGKTVMDAQKRAGTDTDQYMPWMIALTTTINDKAVVIEDLKEMDGFDYLALMGEFGAGFTSTEK